jgi:hypothetical protein
MVYVRFQGLIDNYLAVSTHESVLVWDLSNILSDLESRDYKEINMLSSKVTLLTKFESFRVMSVQVLVSPLRRVITFSSHQVWN